MNKKLVFVSIVILSIVAFILRVFSFTQINGYIDVDPYYHLRLIEVFIHNFPAQLEFDWMTAFPQGDAVFFGPLMTWIGGGLCVLFNITAQNQIVFLTSWIPPVVGAFLVPITYLIGRTVRDWKLGIAAALFAAVVPSLYFFRTLFGYFDHHAFEILFGTLFCLLYLMMIKTEIPNISKDAPRLLQTKRFIITAVSAGIIYFLGTANMPTMLIFAGVIFLFSIAEITIRKDANLVIPVGNLIIFSITSLLLFLTGILSDTFSLYRISSAHIVVFATIVSITGALYIIQRRYKNRGATLLKSIGLTAGLLILVAVVVLIFTSITFNPSNIGILFDQTSTFLNNPYAGTIAETSHWSFDRAVAVYSAGLILSILGLFVCLKKYKNPLFLFIAIWSITMFILTISSMRFEYYLGSNIAILSSIGIIYSLYYIQTPITRLREKYKKRIKIQRLIKLLGMWIQAMIIIGAFVFIGYSFYIDTIETSSASATMSSSWATSLNWLGSHSPDPGVHYTTIYNENYSYPSSAYGIMALGDYGHWILTISHRMPVSNPFQSNLGNAEGVATFFTTEDSNKAYKILDMTRSKYIIIDDSMLNEKFANMLAWSDTPWPVDRYITNTYGVQRYTNYFFDTTIGKLW